MVIYLYIYIDFYLKFDVNDYNLITKITKYK